MQHDIPDSSQEKEQPIPGWQVRPKKVIQPPPTMGADMAAMARERNEGSSQRPSTPPPAATGPAFPLPTGTAPPKTPVTPPAPPAPPPAAVPQPSGSAPDESYISNPFKLFGPAWCAFKLNFVSWLLLILIWLGIELVAAIPMGVAYYGFYSHNYIIALVGSVFLLAIIIAIILISPRFIGAGVELLLASARGKRIKVKDAITAGRPFGWRLVGFTILFQLMLIVGLLFFIIPGILVYAWYSFTPFIIVDENVSIGAAMSRSKQMAKGRFWEIYSLYAMDTLFGIFYIIPFVGSVIAYVLTFIYLFAVPIRYVMLKPFRDAHIEPPPVSGTNYIVPILQLVGVVIFGAIIALGIVSVVRQARHDSHASYQPDSSGHAQSSYRDPNISGDIAARGQTLLTRKQITVSANADWVDTGLKVAAGQHLWTDTTTDGQWSGNPKLFPYSDAGGLDSYPSAYKIDTKANVLSLIGFIGPQPPKASERAVPLGTPAGGSGGTINPGFFEPGNTLMNYAPPETGEIWLRNNDNTNAGSDVGQQVVEVIVTATGSSTSKPALQVE